MCILQYMTSCNYQGCITLIIFLQERSFIQLQLTDYRNTAGELLNCQTGLVKCASQRFVRDEVISINILKKKFNLYIHAHTHTKHVICRSTCIMLKYVMCFLQYMTSSNCEGCTMEASSHQFSSREFVHITLADELQSAGEEGC